MAALGIATKQAVRDAFALAAPSYDRVGPAFFQTFGQRLVELADIRPGMSVLDVGCGAGAALLPAAEAAGPSGRVLGIDLTPGMVERAREAAHQQGLTQVEVSVADAEEPPGPPATWDRVLAAQVLFFLPDVGGALDAYRRVLRPGGRLAFSSWGPQRKEWETVYRAIFGLIPEGAAPDLMPSGRLFGADEAVVSLVTAHGYVDVNQWVESYDVVYESVDQWLEFTRSHGSAPYWEAIPADRRDDARRLAIEATRPLVDGLGRLPVPTTVRYTVASA